MFVCLSRRPTSGLIGTGVAQVTRDWDTTFKVKRSKDKVTRPLWLAVAYWHKPTWTSS